MCGPTNIGWFHTLRLVEEAIHKLEFIQSGLFPSFLRYDRYNLFS